MLMSYGYMEVSSLASKLLKERRLQAQDRDKHKQKLAKQTPLTIVI